MTKKLLTWTKFNHKRSTVPNTIDIIHQKIEITEKPEFKISKVNLLYIPVAIQDACFRAFERFQFKALWWNDGSSIISHSNDEVILLKRFCDGAKNDLRGVIYLFKQWSDHCIYPNHFKMQDSVGIKNALGKELIVENGVSFSKSITQYKAFLNQPSGDFWANHARCSTFF